VLLLLVGSAQAVDTKASTQRKGSGLPLPRFATLKSDEVNVRTGPGSRYPIDWVFKRKGMPVEIVAEYENFRKIRDWQGASGWVYQGLLTGKRASSSRPGSPISTRPRPPRPRWSPSWSRK
jgi:SH3-like domain-containing protein